MKRVLVLAFFATLSVNAATFVVPDDRTLVESSRAIVVATAGTSHARWSDGGWIETVTAMHVDEAIKGTLRSGDALDVVELGGVAGDTGYAVPGSPRYAEGARVLLFLEKNDRGAWTAKSMAVGVFSFAMDERGRELLVRDAAELSGWNIDGTVHREPQRLAATFLGYVRAVARHEPAIADYLVTDPAPLTAAKKATTLATPTITSYLIQSSGKGIRWSTFPSPVIFMVQGKQTGIPDGGLGAVTRGMAAWTNDSGSNIILTNGGTTTVTNGLSKNDGLNTVQFNDPNNEIPGSYNAATGGVLAIGGAWFGSATHTFNGETFLTISEADLVVQNGLTGPGLTGNGFDHVLAHELGHTLGFRHSNLTPDDASPCTSDPNLSCSNSALMNSTVNFDADPTGAALQSWDKEAAAAVYGSGGGTVTPPCTPPSITAQPQSKDLPSNSDVVLSVTATGTAPLSYQWYVGSTGNTGTPVQGGTTPQISVRPSTTTNYWVRVSSNCPPVADSTTATVTVNGCAAVNITSQSPSIAILNGQSTTLTVSATTAGALQYQWYAGPSGNTSTPVNGGTGSSITVKPSATASYWVRMTNSCGAFASSDTIIVTVLPCDAPVIVVQPTGGEAVSGGSFTLSAIVNGTLPMTMQWYEGQSGDTSNPVPNAATATVSVSPIMNARTFWLRATNVCGETSSNAVTVSVVASCVAPVITQQPRDVNASGGSAFLSVAASGTSLEYRWYQGQVFDFTKPVGGSLPTLYVTGITSATPYWVRITNSCGTVNSTMATVSPSVVSRRRAAGH